MNKIVITITFIFWLAVAFFAGAALFGKKQPATLPNYETPSGAVLNTTMPEPQAVVLSEDEVAKHDNRNDCWVTYGSLVYNATSFIDLHPGGANRIIPYCGSDIAAAFEAEGHSNTARNILAGLEIGMLGSNVSPEQISGPAINPVSNDNLQLMQKEDEHEEHEHEDEWEDD